MEGVDNEKTYPISSNFAGLAETAIGRSFCWPKTGESLG